MTGRRRYETILRTLGYRRIAGVDEAGRGPLAGPVVAAAVLLKPDFPVRGIRDSKKLSPARREQLYAQILEHSLDTRIGLVMPEVIDRINIYQATLLAMRRAVAKLRVPPDFLLVDALRLPVSCPHWSMVRGDDRSVAIGAASIVAKVTRDRIMRRYHRRYPDYRFDLNKGYATPEHLESLRRYGPSPVHRLSFVGARAGLASGTLYLSYQEPHDKGRHDAPNPIPTHA